MSQCQRLVSGLREQAERQTSPPNPAQGKHDLPSRKSAVPAPQVERVGLEGDLRGHLLLCCHILNTLIGQRWPPSLASLAN